jgi:3D (Asp-Asp-Asp) domain-containing protein
MNLAMVIVLLGNLSLTSYRSVPEQTDDSPFHTAIGERVTVRGCAVSRDLLKRWGGPLDYGDLIYIEGVGFRFVNDCMAARHKQAVDIWVEKYEDEKAFGVRRGRVYIVHPIKK